MKSEVISIAKRFSPAPAGRYPADGPFNGERFRDQVLGPALKLAKSNHSKVVVKFDDVDGFSSSFLEEVFGGLIRNTGLAVTDLEEHLELVAENHAYDPYLELAWRYIREQAKKH